MKMNFDVTIKRVEEISELPNAWSVLDLQNLLEVADFEDWDEIEETELKDYLLMTLRNMEPEEAASIVLTYKFADRLSKGRIQNMAHEMMNENLWEEYKNPSLHKELFNCAVLLKQSFPRDFPETDALKCLIEVKANANKSIIFNKVMLTRLLSYGMDGHSIVNRLFEDEIKIGSFEEANHIIWDFTVQEVENKYIVEVFSSNYWLEDLDSISNYDASLALEA